jgi:hypothetical protein
LIHDVRLVHHVPLPERHELLEVVGEQLPTDVDAEGGGSSAWAVGGRQGGDGRTAKYPPLGAIPNNLALEQRYDMGVAIPTIDEDHAVWHRVRRLTEQRSVWYERCGCGVDRIEGKEQKEPRASALVIF